jgi:hypothetical protein
MNSRVFNIQLFLHGFKFLFEPEQDPDLDKDLDLDPETCFSTSGKVKTNSPFDGKSSGDAIFHVLTGPRPLLPPLWRRFLSSCRRCPDCPTQGLLVFSSFSCSSSRRLVSSSVRGTVSPEKTIFF